MLLNEVFATFCTHPANGCGAHRVPACMSPSTSLRCVGTNRRGACRYGRTMSEHRPSRRHRMRQQGRRQYVRHLCVVMEDAIDVKCREFADKIINYL